MYDNEGLSQVMAALSEMPEFKWIREKMSSEQAADDITAETEDANALPAPPEAVPPPELNQAPDDDLGDVRDLLVSDDDDDVVPPPDDKDKAMHSARSRSGDTPQKYSQLMRAHNDLAERYSQQSQVIERLVRENADAKRFATLQTLAAEHPDFIDLDDELTKTLYSKGAAMPDAAFDSHVGSLAKYAERATQLQRTAPVNIPEGAVQMPVGDSVERAKYAQQLDAETMRIHTSHINRGEYLDFDQAVELAQKALTERGVQPV